MANVKDGATGTVLTAPSPATSGTSLVLNSGEGARFPAAPFYAIAHPNNTIPTVSTSEKVLVTAVSTDTFTITRAQGIYSAQSIAVGWRISNAIFQEDINNSSIIQNEVPGGTVNGSTTAFTVASAAGMVTGSLKVYKNGVRMKGGGADFTQTATGFTMVTAPATGTVLLVDYNVNGALNNVGTNSMITDEVPTGSVNSSNTSFTAARAYIAGSLLVHINGIRQVRTTDYTETTPASGIFTMIIAPTTGDTITIDYQFNLNPSSNSDTVDGIHANTTATANQLYPLNSSAQILSSLLDFGTSAKLGGSGSTQTTTSATSIDYTGVGTVSVTVPASGKLLIIGTYYCQSNTTGAFDMMTKVVVGSTASLEFTFTSGATFNGSNVAVFDILTGLTPGANTMKMQIRVNSSSFTGFWDPVRTKILAIPIGA